MEVFPDTRQMPQNRTIDWLIEYLDRPYAATSRGREMAGLGKLLDIKRDGVETAHAPWIRPEAIPAQMESQSDLLSSELVSMRGLKSMKLAHHQKTSILTAIDCRNSGRNLENPKSAIIRLFGMYRDASVKTDSEAFAVEEELPQLADGGILLFRKAKSMKRKPGMATQSIRRSPTKMNVENHALVANAGSGSKTARCFPCGKYGHVLKTAHYRPNKRSHSRRILELTPGKRDAHARKGLPCRRNCRNYAE